MNIPYTYASLPPSPSLPPPPPDNQMEAISKPRARKNQAQQDRAYSTRMAHNRGQRQESYPAMRVTPASSSHKKTVRTLHRCTVPS